MSNDCRDRLIAVCDILDRMKARAEEIKSQMADLEELGIVNARRHWPKDKPGALELLYSSNSAYALETGRRRQYIGKNPDRVAEAQASLKRFDEHRKLDSLLRRTTQLIYRAENYIDNLESLMGFWEE